LMREAMFAWFVSVIEKRVRRVLVIDGC